MLPRLKTDLVDLMEACIDGTLDQADLEWDPRTAICVVMASAGYPGPCEKGHPIGGLLEAANTPDVRVYHAGTALAAGKVVTAGGRVLGVTALGDDLGQAREKAYDAVGKIQFEGAHYRTDIGHRALREKNR